MALVMFLFPSDLGDLFMYQVLVNTKFVHTDARVGEIKVNVLSFNRQDEAKAAAGKINEAVTRACVTQWAIVLF
jgi:hypothetical protein